MTLSNMLNVIEILKEYFYNSSLLFQKEEVILINDQTRMTTCNVIQLINLYERFSSDSLAFLKFQYNANGQIILLLNPQRNNF
jgi:hypothetical protein